MKKDYQAPKLEIHGDVSKLTNKQGHGNGPDNDFVCVRPPLGS